LRRATREKKELLRALTAVEDGDFSTRIESRYVDEEIAGAFNRVVRLNARRAEEFERVSRLVGKEGKLFNRASIEGLKGSWSRRCSRSTPSSATSSSRPSKSPASSAPSPRAT
jgi:hypothetical protein